MVHVCNQMRMCWNEKPESRLTSLALLKILDKIYAELSEPKPIRGTYVPPPVILLTE